MRVLKPRASPKLPQVPAGVHGKLKRINAFKAFICSKRLSVIRECCRRSKIVGPYQKTRMALFESICAPINIFRSNIKV